MRFAIFACLIVACRTPKVSPPPRVEPPPPVEARAPPPQTDASYFPLVDGATYEYDATFGAKRSHERRIVRRVSLAVGTMYFFVDADADPNDDVSIGSNNFGLGAYRMTDAGLVTADAYMRSDLQKIGETGLQTIVAFPLVVGATSTVHGGKKLETTVGANEDVTVPAGTFHCVKLEQREVWPSEVYEGAVWLARGVGAVKRIYVTGRTEVLTSYRLP
jgi:hypothetical protein